MMKRALGLSGGLSFAALAALLVGCPSSPPAAPEAAGTVTAAPATAAPATAPPASRTACTSNADCASGEECQGSEGCDAPWTCGPPRRCTRDSVEWCGCD